MNPEVCIVDDEPGITDMCRDYLKGDYSIRVFTSPAEALKEFNKDYRPDVLLTDIKMPEMDGFTMAKQIHQKAPGVPVVMMSGYADKQHVLEALENDAYGFLEKPFDPKKMKGLLASVVHKSQHSQALEELAESYRELSELAMQLNTSYIDRYAIAENRLHQAGIALTDSPDHATAFLNAIQKENQLNRKLEVVKAKIATAKQRL